VILPQAAQRPPAFYFAESFILGKPLFAHAKHIGGNLILIDGAKQPSVFIFGEFCEKKSLRTKNGKVGIFPQA